MEKKYRRNKRRSSEVKMTSLTFRRGRAGILFNLGKLVAMFSVSFTYFLKDERTSQCIMSHLRPLPNYPSPVDKKKFCL